MERPGFFFCICPDAALMRSWMERELLEPLKNAGGAGGLLGGAAPSSAPDVQTWWADEGLDRRFWDALTLLAMDGRTRVLVVRGAHQLPADVWKKLSSALATPRPGILPVFCLECPWEKGQPKLPAHVAKLKCLAFAEKQQWLWRSAGLEPRSLRQYVQREAVARRLSMSPEALNTLSEMLIPDASAIRGVLEQLSLASPDGSVDVALVRQMTEFTPDAVIFDFIRQLENGNARAVWKTLLREGDGGESLLFPLLTLMAREARTLWQMMAGEKVFVPQYVEAEKRRLAAKLGFEGLTAVFEALTAAELAVKSGARSPLQAMEELVASLSMLFGSATQEGRRPC
ncbi:DNA polymerase III subunit delta [Mailhella sp.]|uniref:DNA polymerase III subunit delta n=1 Tax=Mailhella sp. TaxID=1981029 RepID=UPI0040633A16